MAIERKNNCYLVGVCHLRRTTIESFFLLVDVGAASPIGDLERAIVCGADDAAAKKTSGRASNKQVDPAHDSPPEGRLTNAMSLHCLAAVKMQSRVKGEIRAGRHFDAVMPPNGRSGRATDSHLKSRGEDV